jgi:signal transduction histidine kinase
VRLPGRLSSSFEDSRAWVRVPLRLLFTVVAAGLTLWLTGLLEHALGRPVMFPAFIGIVFVSAGIGGISYGLATTVLFGIGYAFLFMEPRGGLGLEDTLEQTILAVYAAVGFAVAVVGGAVRKAWARAREDHRAVTEIHEQREDLLKTLTHDVRTPLNAITMNAAMIERDPEDPTVVRRRARAIKKSAGSVAGMLSDLIDTAYLESGQLRLEAQPVDLASYLVELKSRLEVTLPVDRVTCALPEGLPAVYVDPRRLERIFVNLLSNALKYAPPPTPVVLGATQRDGAVVVSVADRGPGISEHDLPHVFEKYFRAVDTRRKEGLGIGLYAARMLVQAHGGRIWVDSAVGKGTTFYVALPTAAPEERSVGRGATAPAREAALPYRRAPASAGSDSGSPGAHSS